MRRVSAIVLALAIVLTACGGSDQGFGPVGPSAAAAVIDDPSVVVLDIRTPEEVAVGTLPGSVSVVDFYSPGFADHLASLDREATYLVYCRSGNRSSQATALMADLGFTSVYELDGGIVRWAAEGGEVVTG